MELAVSPAVSPAADEEIIRMLLEDKRSPQTRRAYAADLRYFFGGDPNTDTLGQFLGQNTAGMAYTLTQFKIRMLNSGLAEATVNRRLAAVKSLISFARRMGRCDVDPRGLVDGEKVRTYRDTAGISVSATGKLLRQPRTDTVRGKRDLALLLLLVENGLRRAEVCSLDLQDFEPTDRRIWIRGKGRGSQRTSIDLSCTSTDAILAYIAATRRLGATEGPLFLTCDRRGQRTRLTASGLYFLVRDYGQRANLPKRLSPHRLRHTAITAAVDAQDGKIEFVQEFSRHAQMETVRRYIDNRRSTQRQTTERLSNLFAAAMAEAE